jgi:hypothetical protein
VRVIFLDFDGVVHPQEDPDAAGRMRWIPILVHLLAPAPDVSIIVHSTWRYQYTDGELKELLGELGNRFIGSAPRMPREQAIETPRTWCLMTTGRSSLPVDSTWFCANRAKDSLRWTFKPAFNTGSPEPALTEVHGRDTECPRGLETWSSSLTSTASCIESRSCGTRS